jgi:predicted Zn-dependent protease
MRYKAATKLIEVGVLSDKKARLWLKGAWQEVMLFAYEFHNEPSVVHSRPVEALLRSAIKCLKKDTKIYAEQAEALLQEALQTEPDAPDLGNNLAVAYTIQGREADAEALIAEIVAKHPDYLLTQVALARFHLAKDELDAADALLKPMLSR